MNRIYLEQCHRFGCIGSICYGQGQAPSSVTDYTDQIKSLLVSHLCGTHQIGGATEKVAFGSFPQKQTGEIRDGPSPEEEGLGEAFKVLEGKWKADRSLAKRPVTEG